MQSKCDFYHVSAVMHGNKFSVLENILIVEFLSRCHKNILTKTTFCKPLFHKQNYRLTYFQKYFAHH